jgi:hypothetical protein
VTFSLAFVTTPEQVDALAPAIGRRTEGDAIVWFAYPKGTSKRYKSQIDRDHGWNMLGREGFEPVRMVAIDEDWSAKALPARQIHQEHDSCKKASTDRARYQAADQGSRIGMSASVRCAYSTIHGTSRRLSTSKAVDYLLP